MVQVHDDQREVLRHRVQRALPKRLKGKVQPPPIVKPGQRVGEGLGLGAGPRILKPAVGARQLLRHGAVGFVQEQELHRQVGGGEVPVGQVEAADRLDQPDPEPEVENEAAVRQADGPTTQDLRRLGARAQEHPLGMGQPQQRASRRLADHLERRLERRRIADQPSQRGAGRQDLSCGIHVQVHGHQRQRGLGKRHAAPTAGSLIEKGRPSLKSTTGTSTRMPLPLTSITASTP